HSTNVRKPPGGGFEAEQVVRLAAGCNNGTARCRNMLRQARSQGAGPLQLVVSSGLSRCEREDRLSCSARVLGGDSNDAGSWSDSDAGNICVGRAGGGENVTRIRNGNVRETNSRSRFGNSSLCSTCHRQ